MTILLLLLAIGQQPCERVADWLAACQPHTMRLSCCEQAATRFCSVYSAPVVALPKGCTP